MSPSGTFHLFDDNLSHFLSATIKSRSYRHKGFSFACGLQQATQECICPVGKEPGDELPLTTIDFTSVLNEIIIADGVADGDQWSPLVVDVDKVTESSSFPTPMLRGAIGQTPAPSTTPPSMTTTLRPTLNPTSKNNANQFYVLMCQLW